MRRAAKKPPPFTCEECDYELTGLSAAICPECGSPILLSPRPPPSYVRLYQIAFIVNCVWILGIVFNLRINEFPKIGFIDRCISAGVVMLIVSGFMALGMLTPRNKRAMILSISMAEATLLILTIAVLSSS